MGQKAARRGCDLRGVVAIGLALAGSAMPPALAAAAAPVTQTPIKHVVILFQENVSFDHYFGTYPQAQNKAGETPFSALATTPSVNGYNPALLSNNPNRTSAGTQVNPFRLPPSQAYTCSQNHSYMPEQLAVHSGLMDGFVTHTAGSGEGCATDGSTVMAYYDGNTVTGLWNYAQHYAMNDNTFGSSFGPSTPGALNLASGQTHGGILHFATTNGSVYVNPSDSSVTDIGDLDAYLDDCGNDKGGTHTTTATLEMTSRNIGDLLNAQGVTWGWFQGGFAPTSPAVLNGDGTTMTPATCAAAHTGHPGVPNPVITPGADIHTAVTDYVSHHEPFMFYASTRNPHHLRPSSTAAVGTTDQANHQYDTSDFFTALNTQNLPAVSFIKAPAYQNGHPGNSDPITEQTWLVQVINALQQSSYWSQTAVIITYDDSDGWYDHVNGPIVSPSDTLDDALAGTNNCGTPQSGAFAARCGNGPRLPFVAVSPWAKVNYVDNTLLDQTSIIAFIEYNWGLGFIDGAVPPPTGQTSFDRYAGSILQMFNFGSLPNLRHLILNPDGTVVSDN